MYGEEGRGTIQVLLDEIDFKDQRSQGHKDTQKDEIQRSLKRPNFVTIVCQSFEGGGRQKILQHGNKLPDDYLPNVCKLLKLSSIQTSTLSFALVQSQYRSLCQDALRLLKLNLPLIVPGSVNFAEIHEELLHGLAHFVKSNEDLSAPEICTNFFNAIRLSSQGKSGQQSSMFAPINGTNSNIPSEQLPSAGANQKISIASVLQDLGCQCSISFDTFRNTLKNIGIPIDEKQMAEIIISLLQRHEDNSKNWNLDIVCEVLTQETRNLNLNWTLVTQCFDRPNLVLQTKMDFEILVRVFARISGAALPAAGLLRRGIWNNRTAQLVLLTLAANAPRNMVDFSSLVLVENQIQGLRTSLIPNQNHEEVNVPLPHNFSWICIPFYETLLALATSGLAMEVLEVFNVAAATYPEYIAVCLSQVHDTSGVRAEILRRTLPLFTGLGGSRPTSESVMMKLSQIKPELLVLLFRIAFKRVTCMQDAIDTATRLNSFGSAIMRQVEETGTVDELLGYWCIKADRSAFNLEEICAAILERSSQVARIFLVFAKTHASNLRPRSADGGLLSFENFAILLRAIQNYPSVVPIEEVRILATVFAQQQKLFRQQEQQNQYQQNTIANQLTSSPHLLPQQSPVDVPSNNTNNNVKNQESTVQSSETSESSDEIEEEANAYFHKIYTSEISIPDVIQLLKKFKSSENVREQEIFRTMLHNLFDEYRFFHRYPEKELHVTGNLFGTLIQHQLVSSITLGIALRYVLEALRKNPEEGVNEKMFRFGKISLSQFQSRLNEWPQYCSHLVQIPHLNNHCPELFQEAQKSIANASNPNNHSESHNTKSLTDQMSTLNIAQSTVGGIGMAPSAVLPTIQSAQAQAGLINSTSTENLAPVTLPIEEIMLPPSIAPKITPICVVKSSFSVIESMAAVNVDASDLISPPENIHDQISFIVNNISKSNCEQKSVELRLLLVKDYYQWFANYLVVKRISVQPNLHGLYLLLLELIDSNGLNKVLLDCAFYNVTKLLQSPNITTSSSERSILRNLGMWLGQMTLARNKPLLQRRINLKELLFWGYETGRLIAVCSFIAKIVEGIRDSKVFRPPNPWLMALLGVMRELYETEDLKMNIKFEVQVLCKNINIKIEDIPRGNALSKCRTPIKDSRNSDFNVAKPSANQVASSSTSTPIVINDVKKSPIPTISASSSLNNLVSEEEKKPTDISNISPNINEQTVIPNLTAYITINSTIQFFNSYPQHRRLVPIAIDRAIREILQPVVERSVATASVTTKQLLLKDYCTEANEQQLRAGAHLMISNLAGSIALITCKEPLRISICNHLRTLLAPHISDISVIEQIASVCSSENLELGCMLIEKASMEKAVRDIDDSLTSSMQLRRKMRENGQVIEDISIKSSKVLQELPDSLKPLAGGLLPSQLSVYEGFQRQRVVPTTTLQPKSVGSSPTTTQPSPVLNSTAIPSQISTLDMSQALHSYQNSFSRLDALLKAVAFQAQGRDVSLSMLGSDHEIISVLRDIVNITNSIQGPVRNETAMTFCENVFKRILESVNVVDMLRLEIMVGILESIRDICGGPKKENFIPDIVNWLNHYGAFNHNDETSKKMHLATLGLLLRAKLFKSQDADAYFAAFMDAGRNMIWVELALTFVRHCLAEGLAATWEFANTFETVSKMRPTNTVVRKQLQKWLTDLRALAAAKDEQKANTPPNQVNATNITNTKDTSFREHVTVLLEKWLRVWQSSNDQIFGQYLQLMHQNGVLKTEEAADNFFLISIELCIEACLKSAQIATSISPSTESSDVSIPKPEPATTLTYTVVDALSKLFLLLVRLADKEAGDASVRVNLLSRILNAVVRSLVEEHESKKKSNLTFDQRPHFRLLSNLANDIEVPDPKVEPSPVTTHVLSTYCQIYLMIQPSQLPGFAFAWLQLVSHKSFMPHLLLIKNQKGWPLMHRIIMSLLFFMQPFLKNAQMNEPIRKLYKGTLRVLLILLHDFPEFLCDYHISFCEIIPRTCVQLRNLILSAYPQRSMKLPDPFTPNLKVDQLPEILIAPRILSDYMTILTERGIKKHLDTYFAERQPEDLPTILNSLISPSEGQYDLPLLTSIVLYIGVLAINNKLPIQNSPTMSIFKKLCISLDTEGRYYLFNSMANQLRFPNSHTYYFSSVLLFLFADADDNEYLQEQITRVLLERLIAHRPHPWGLLITFIELIKNPRFEFWRKSFTSCAPEIEKVFESVARSCMGGSKNSTSHKEVHDGNTEKSIEKNTK